MFCFCRSRLIPGVAWPLPTALFLVAASLPTFAAETSGGTGSSRFLVYLGTYTGAKSKGIHVCRFDAQTGALTDAALAAETPNPTFLALHPKARVLYAANEIGDFAGRRNNGAVSAFAIDATSGQLSLLNQESTRGGGPCHLTVDPAGQAVLVANYGGGSVAALPIDAAGRLQPAGAFFQHQGSSVNKNRQEGPHGHFVGLDPASRFALVCDLGLDQVLVYRFDPAGAWLTPHQPAFAALKPGAGPRHLAFHPNGRFVYVINELDSSIVVFAWNAGVLREVQHRGTLPENFAGQSTTAEIAVHPSGKFLYGSNRGHDSLALYAIDPDKGTLRFVEHTATQGRTPRNFAIDPTGRYLFAANQDSDSVVIFRVNPETGRLTATGQTLSVGAPVCVVFAPL